MLLCDMAYPSGRRAVRSRRFTKMKTLLNVSVLLTLVSTSSQAQINAGEMKSDPNVPFTMTQVATFKLPWRIAFLPDGRMLVTEKVGPVWLVTQKGEKTPVDNVPRVLWQGQGGMLGVFLSPHYATDQNVYLTYSEPGEEQGTSGLALARARLTLGDGKASLDGLQVLWHDLPKGRGGQFGAQIAFSPDGEYLFLAVGDRQRMTPAQNPDTEVGKILRLTLDGKPAPGNPMAGKTGGPTRPLINPPRGHDAAARADSRHGSGEDPAADARRQAGAGESHGRQNRRSHAPVDQSAAGYRGGQGSAGPQHVHG